MGRRPNNKSDAEDDSKASVSWRAELEQLLWEFQLDLYEFQEPRPGNASDLTWRVVEVLAELRRSLIEGEALSLEDLLRPSTRVRAFEFAKKDLLAALLSFGREPWHRDAIKGFRLDRVSERTPQIEAAMHRFSDELRLPLFMAIRTRLAKWISLPQGGEAGLELCEQAVFAVVRRELSGLPRGPQRKRRKALPAAVWDPDDSCARELRLELAGRLLEEVAHLRKIPRANELGRRRAGAIVSHGKSRNPP